MLTTKQIKETGYETALEQVIAIRLQRKKIYGDVWKQQKDYRLVAMVMEKADRLEKLVFSEENNYENIQDTLIDCINYSLFLLQNKIDKQSIKTLIKKK